MLPSMPQMWGGGIRLSGLNDTQLMQLSKETGVSFQLLKSQQMAEMASSGSQGASGEKNESFVPTVEIKLKTNPKNPRKARKQNIKMLRKSLRPPRYNFGLFRVYRYNAAHECACCGVDIRRFIEGDNAYAHIVDDDTNMSLSDIYWFDEDTGNAKKPHARSHGDIGDELNSTLCPAHLHIYHTLKKILMEEQLENEGITRPVSRGTKFLRVAGLSPSKVKNRSTNESLIKYEPFFRMVQQDVQHQKGISMNQHPNPITGVADLVTITFDLRALQIQESMKQNGMIGIPPQQQAMTSPAPNVMGGGNQ